MKRRISRSADIKWGVTGGLTVAALYSFWVIGVYIFFGAEPFERQGVRLWSVVLTYVIVGALGGGIVGALRPLNEVRGGTYVVGLIVGMLGAVGIGLLVAGWPTNWGLAEWGTVPIVGTAGGWVVGSELAKQKRST